MKTTPQVTVVVALPPDLLTALDTFIADVAPTMSRAEALRYAFHDWAIGQGLIRFREDPEMAN